ncbi:sigma-70 family RNA polymerase sigma factor [Baaleninema simplex]|uniref:sigma-70 family RNA polymerase sigma factor n=1 Tax=Baaleninema simplex TaxID=2862350 RepID=UPI000344A627|nr:sigma-70 family RNA polymerase sigma factor [Baaleninema simplex]
MLGFSFGANLFVRPIPNRRYPSKSTAGFDAYSRQRPDRESQYRRMRGAIISVSPKATLPMSPSDIELYQSLQAGDSSALGTLYDRYGGIVYGLALKVLKAPQEAEDLTQEIFLILWRKQNYNPQRGSLSTFLTMLTRSRAIDRLRSRGRKQKFLGNWGTAMSEDAIVSTTPFDEVSLQERRDRVRDALDDLPSKYRQVLELAYYQGMSQSEISAYLDLPLGTVKTRSRQGLLKLREHLRDWIG